MRVDLLEVRGWPLFAADDRFHLAWSQLRPHPLRPGEDAFFTVACGGEEVARLHLDCRPMALGAWRGVPEVGPVVRVQLLEVAAEVQGRGLGRAVMRQVQQRCAPARCVAVSLPESTGFWKALGWARFDHRRDGGRLPLFVDRGAR